LGGGVFFFLLLVFFFVLGVGLLFCFFSRLVPVFAVFFSPRHAPYSDGAADLLDWFTGPLCCGGNCFFPTGVTGFFSVGG